MLFLIYLEFYFLAAEEYNFFVFLPTLIDTRLNKICVVTSCCFRLGIGGCWYLCRMQQIPTIPYLLTAMTMASIFFAFYFLQKFFAKLVFFANKKQKKTKKNSATYIIIQVHLNYSKKYFLKIYSKLWSIFLKFLIKPSKNGFFFKIENLWHYKLKYKYY